MIPNTNKSDTTSPPIPITLTEATSSWQQAKRFFGELWPISGALNDIAPLDGLRGLAVLLTLVFHLLTAMIIKGDMQSGVRDIIIATKVVWIIGATGVHLFFVLSGFLLFMPYARAILNKEDFPSTRKFYLRRAIRILPAYWCSLCILTLLNRILHLSPVSNTDIVTHIFLVHNWSWQGINAINGAFWTMAVECQFYLLLPAIAYILYHFARKRQGKLSIAVALLTFAATPLFGLLLNYAQTNHLPIFNHFTIFYVFGYMSLFAIGGLCGFLYVATTQGHIKWLNGKRVSQLGQISGIVGLLCIIAFLLFSHIDSFDITYWVISVPLLGVGYGCITLGVLLHEGSATRFFSLPVVRFIGIISYSLYIWNNPIYSRVIIPVTAHLRNDIVAVLMNIILTVVLIIPFAFLSYHLVERPFIEMRKRQH